MPTTKSAKKALTVSIKKRSRNRRFLELLKESTKKLEALMAGAKPKSTEVADALSLVYSRIDTLEKKNIIHKNNAAHKKSAFARSVKSLMLK